jgi:hypothetical protein
LIETALPFNVVGERSTPNESIFFLTFFEIDADLLLYNISNLQLQILRTSVIVRKVFKTAVVRLRITMRHYENLQTPTPKTNARLFNPSIRLNSGEAVYE